MPRLTSKKGALVGRTLRTPVTDVYIPEKEVLRHAIIVGATGSGKTTTAATLAIGLSAFGEVIIIDWFGEYQDLLRGFKKLRIVRPGIDGTKIPLPRNIHDFLSIMDEVLELTSPQAYILRRVLTDCAKYDYSLKELLTYLETYEVDAKWMIESKYSLIRKIEPLINCGIFTLDDDFKVSKAAKGLITIVDMSHINDVIIKKIATISLLRILEHMKLVNRGQGNLYVIVEEVHNIIGANRGLIERLVSEVRKLGIGLVLVTQSPSILGYRVLTNVNVRVIHSLRYKDDIDIMCRTLGYTSSNFHDLIPRLGVGEAILDASFMTFPAVIKVAHPLELINNLEN